jgi:hypothetical protein
VQFAEGAHGTGVDAGNQDKVAAIASYIVSGEDSGMSIFRNREGPEGWLDVLSNVSWLVLISILAVLYASVRWAFKTRRWVGIVYAMLIVGILYSI